MTSFSNVFLGEEWMSSVIGVTITYIVFVMGILPTLISQTFVPDALRTLYTERLDSEGTRIFWRKIFVVFFLLFISNPGICKLFSFLDGYKAYGEIIWPTLILSGCIWVLYSGTSYLTHHINSTRNIWEVLVNKIIKDSKSSFSKRGKINEKDIDALALISKEIPQGNAKNIFLKECSKFVHYLLKFSENRNIAIITDEILEKVIASTILGDPTKNTEENVKTALDILVLIQGKVDKSST